MPPEQRRKGRIRGIDQPQENVLHRNVFILHIFGGLLRLLQRFIHLGGNIKLIRLAAVARNARQGGYQLLCLLLHLPGRKVHFNEHLRDELLLSRKQRI